MSGTMDRRQSGLKAPSKIAKPGSIPRPGSLQTPAKVEGIEHLIIFFPTFNKVYTSMLFLCHFRFFFPCFDWKIICKLSMHEIQQKNKTKQDWQIRKIMQRFKISSFCSMFSPKLFMLECMSNPFNFTSSYRQLCLSWIPIWSNDYLS